MDSSYKKPVLTGIKIPALVFAGILLSAFMVLALLPFVSFLKKPAAFSATQQMPVSDLEKNENSNSEKEVVKKNLNPFVTAAASAQGLNDRILYQQEHCPFLLPKGSFEIQLPPPKLHLL